MIIILYLLSACGGNTEEIYGTYQTTLTSVPSSNMQKALRLKIPSDSTFRLEQGIGLSIYLSHDQRAEMNIRFLDDKHSIQKKGSWELSNNQRVTLYFVENNGRYAPDTLQLRAEGLRLILKGRAPNATDDITLLKKQDVN